VAKLKNSGFTLLELLVVLVIAAIMTAMISMSVASSPGRDLRFEAERLTQLLALAREEAQVRGKAIRFETTVESYRFLSLLDREWQPIPNEPDLRERRWEKATQVVLQRRDDRPFIEFGRDSVDSPFKMRLTRDEATVVIAANGLGGFVVE
jgi:general secretion pathway protein H